MTRVLVLAVFVASCGGAPSKESAVQAGLNAGMLACEVLAQDPSIPREPSVDEWCGRLLKGCPTP